MTNFKSLAAGLYLGFAAILVSAAPSQAVIMEGNDAMFGAGSITIDTVNMSEWLDLTESDNLSFNQVAAQFGSGGTFETWRHATAADLTLLFAEVGFSPPFPDVDVGSDPAVRNLILLLGVTFSQDNSFVGELRLSEGVYDDGEPTMVGFGTLRNITGGSNTAAQHSADQKTDFTTPDASSSQSGNWLVRRHVVPEPATLALFGLGLACLGFARRRKAA